MAKTYTIAEVAEELGVSLRTLRFYEEKGLVSPEHEPGSYQTRRRYRLEDLARLRRVRALVAFGFRLDEIGTLLQLLATDPRGAYVAAAIEAGRKRLEEIRTQQAELALSVPALELWLAKLERERVESLEGVEG